MNYQDYWSTKKQSYQRQDNSDFLTKKVDEHLSLLTKDEKNQPILDIGCGAGELFTHMLGKCNLQEAIDYSSSMINATKERLSQLTTHNSQLTIRVANAKEHIKQTRCSVWIACQSINQYLGQSEIELIIKALSTDKKGTSLFLLDTIDPDKWDLWQEGLISYNKRLPSRKIILKHSIQRLLSIFNKKYILEMVRIGEMGYAYRPYFFIRIAEKYNLDITIVSSKFYEYRYHVIFRKKSHE